MDWWSWKTRWTLGGDVRALFISACFDGFAEILFLHEICNAETQGFQNLHESAMNQLGSFWFSLQVAALALSETWSYFIEQEKTGLTLSSSHTRCCPERFMFNRALSVRREVVKQPHATANQNCALKAALKSSATWNQIPTFQKPKESHLAQ